MRNIYWNGKVTTHSLCNVVICHCQQHKNIECCTKTSIMGNLYDWKQYNLVRSSCKVHIFLHSIHKPKNALNKIQFMISIKLFDTRVPFLGSLLEKKHKSNNSYSSACLYSKYAGWSFQWYSAVFKESAWTSPPLRPPISRNIIRWYTLFFPVAQQPKLDIRIGCLSVAHSASYTVRHPLLVRLLCTSDQPVAESTT
jgi:hypothetical protein